MSQARTLRVYPNPWSARDKRDLPCGICPRDPESDGGGPGLFVGARIDRKETRVTQDVPPEAQNIISPIQVTAYEYMGIASSDPQLAPKLLAAAPVEIPRSKYYRDRIAEGSLICADADSAKQCGRAFIAPAKVFARYMPKLPKPAQAAETDPSGGGSPGASGNEPTTNAPTSLEQASTEPANTKGRRARSEVTQ